MSTRIRPKAPPGSSSYLSRCSSMRIKRPPEITESTAFPRYSSSIRTGRCRISLLVSTPAWKPFSPSNSGLTSASSRKEWLMTTAAIEFHNVTKVYQRRFSDERIEALTDVSFEVSPGEVCAFLGPNGAGKTTSISILMGFLFADSGDIRVLGHAPGDVRAKARIGFLPEN